MLPLRLQFFLAYGVYGGLLPFLPGFLEKERALTSAQIGYVFGVSSIATVLTPVLLTLLADTVISSRRLIGLLSLIGGAALAAMLFVQGFWPTLLCYSIWALTFMPVTPLTDAYHFSVQARRLELGQPAVPYHHLRPLGTIGFLVPNAILFFLLSTGSKADVAIIAAAIMCLLSAMNSLLLPEAERVVEVVQPAGVKRSLPTLAALKAMVQPPVLVFAVALFLVHLACAAYYTFYPIYLTKEVGIDRQWAGLIISIGVTIEIGFILAFGWMLRRWGLKAILIAGMFASAVRLALLGAFPTPFVAIGTQVFHGIWVVMLHVAPPGFINDHAGSRYRNSMQGLFVMLVYGTSRLIGNAVGGHIAEVSLRAVFFTGAGLCMAAVVLMVVAFHEKGKATGAERCDAGAG
ncbi:MAG: MFS transporter [Phycisphaeraceae bacterium]